MTIAQDDATARSVFFRSHRVLCAAVHGVVFGTVAAPVGWIFGTTWQAVAAAGGTAAVIWGTAPSVKPRSLWGAVAGILSHVPYWLLVGLFTMPKQTGHGDLLTALGFAIGMAGPSLIMVGWLTAILGAAVAAPLAGWGLGMLLRHHSGEMLF